MSHGLSQSAFCFKVRKKTNEISEHLPINSGSIQEIGIQITAGECFFKGVTEKHFSYKFILVNFETGISQPNLLRRAFHNMYFDNIKTSCFRTIIHVWYYLAVRL
jgi:hypothetical protein